MGGRGWWGGEARRRWTRRRVRLWWRLCNAQTTTWGPRKYIWSPRAGIQMLMASHTISHMSSKNPADNLVFKALFLLCSQLLYLWPSILLKGIYMFKKNLSKQHWGFRTTALTKVNRLFRLNSVTMTKGSGGVQGSSTSGGKYAGWTGKKRTLLRSQVRSVTLNCTGFQVFGKTILAPSHLPQWLVFAEKCSANCKTLCFYAKFDYIHIKDQPV